MGDSITTPVFRMAYPQVFEAKPNKFNGKLQYSLIMLFPKSADLGPLRKLLFEAVKGKFGEDQTKWPLHFRAQKFSTRVSIDGKDGWPIVDGDMKTSPGYAGCFAISAKANPDFKPLVVDINRQPVLDVSSVFGGRKARASVSAWAHKHDGGSANVGLNLIMLQILDDDGTVYRGGPSQDPEAAFGPATPTGADDPANYAQPEVW